MRRRIVSNQAIGGQFQDSLNLHLAGPAAGSGAGGVAYRLEAAMPTVNGSDDPGLGDAVAVAYLGVVRQILNVQIRYGVGGRGKSNSERFSGSASSRSKACKIRGTVRPSPSRMAPVTLPSRTITFL